MLARCSMYRLSVTDARKLTDAKTRIAALYVKLNAMELTADTIDQLVHLVYGAPSLCFCRRRSFSTHCWWCCAQLHTACTLCMCSQPSTRATGNPRTPRTMQSSRRGGRAMEAGWSA
eukprot:3420243-Pleurochrysis_carterae.AAC.1